MTRIGSLCSGYGGLELGLMAVVEGSVAWHVENDPHPAGVLEARFPGIPNHGDLTTLDLASIEPVDILTAGYPCQPFSAAGKRLGAADERHLWPFVAHAIGVLRPPVVVLENVANHLVLGFDAVLADLAAMGYDATWGLVRASDAGAPHRRERLFVVATDTAAGGWRGSEGQQRGLGTPQRLASAVAHARGEAVGLGTGLREGQPRRVGRGRPDHDAASAPAADATSDRRDEGRSEPAGQLRRLDAAERGYALVADADSDGCESVRRCHDERHDADRRSSEDVAWGVYEPAIRHWEAVTGRPAPCPTEPGGRGGRRLSPRLNEWMMGLPDGWVTDILPRSPALKCLGNGVVPQQAALAIRTLLGLESEMAA